MISGRVCHSRIFGLETRDEEVSQGLSKSIRDSWKTSQERKGNTSFVEDIHFDSSLDKQFELYTFCCHRRLPVVSDSSMGDDFQFFFVCGVNSLFGSDSISHFFGPQVSP